MRGITCLSCDDVFPRVESLAADPCPHRDKTPSLRPGPDVSFPLASCLPRLAFLSSHFAHIENHAVPRCACLLSSQAPGGEVRLSALDGQQRSQAEGERERPEGGAEELRRQAERGQLGLLTESVGQKVFA